MKREEEDQEDHVVQEDEEEDHVVQDKDAVQDKIGTSMTFTKEKEFALQEFAKLIEWSLSTIKYKHYRYTSITYFTGLKIDEIPLGILL